MQAAIHTRHNYTALLYTAYLRTVMALQVTLAAEAQSAIGAAELWFHNEALVLHMSAGQGKENVLLLSADCRWHYWHIVSVLKKTFTFDTNMDACTPFRSSDKPSSIHWVQLRGLKIKQAIKENKCFNQVWLIVNDRSSSGILELNGLALAAPGNWVGRLSSENPIINVTRPETKHSGRVKLYWGDD